MIEDFLRWLGFGLCHQLPERSFFGGGLQTPVCARDIGIYVGFLVSVGLILALSGRRAGRPPRWPVIAIAIVFFGVMVWDGVTSYTGMRPTTNSIRLITGILAGFAMPVVFVPVLLEELYRSSNRRALETPKEVIGWLLGVPVTYALLAFAAPMLGAGYPLLVAASVIGTFTVVNLLLVVLVMPWSRTGRKHVWLALAIALLFTFVEIAAASALRSATLSAVIG